MQITRWVYDRADRLKGGHSTGQADYYKVDRLWATFKYRGEKITGLAYNRTDYRIGRSCDMGIYMKLFILTYQRKEETFLIHAFEKLFQK